MTLIDQRGPATPESRDVVVLRNLRKTFRGRGGSADVVAIDNTSMRIERGSTLGIVGESGSGKSTLARTLLGLIAADSGEANVLGVNTVGATERSLRPLRRRAGIVFQEPYEALDPRMKVGDLIGEPLKLHRGLRGTALRERVTELMQLVVLDPALAERYPHQMSGGQQQRTNIARALATEPELLVLDEPTSALDVSVRSEILSLLVSLQNRLDMTYVLVSHDLPTIRAVCSHLAVMYLGRVVEQGTVEQVLGSPSHPYTRFLLGSALSLDPDEKTAPPAVNSVGLDGKVDRRGCCFAPRCVYRVDECTTSIPKLMHRNTPSEAACHRAGTV
ncbi:ABC transporter ATP-binding protein [Nakamurella leprariae]|uniref:ABC transporter ATP-binding protein n=1 Tax=Nakamurella leprariae TaxID=2803911 RepID=A0A938YFA8_9ACTN|nr:oligopeptide/dipeptide ABC transporter ATP-binding protein [Nakamurella leprariae]MBM9467362.1 ABC transporter ATP-binding protein [Nakamurella leprariae]